MSHYRREEVPRRYGYDRGYDRRDDGRPRASPMRSNSRSRSPDPVLTRYLAEQAQARPSSPSQEEHRRQRIAAGGVFNVKSRHERERDEAERKRKEEEENAAKAFREFVADMEGAGGSRNAKPREVRPAYGKNSGTGFVQAGGSAYDPRSRQPQQQQQAHSTQAQSHSTRDGSARKAAAFDDEAEADEERSKQQEQEAIARREPPGKRKGAMQDFLGEIQRDQAMREERLRDHITESSSVSSLLAAEMKPAAGKPRDEKDASSSNICILNLPANISEMSFGEYFSQYGDVASVKIMWPRVEEMVPLPSSIRVTRHSGATGFVNFMRRSDAEVAYKKMSGTMWAGCEIHTAWGKSLPKPSAPLYLRSDYDRNSGRGPRTDDRVTRDRKRRSSRSPASRNHRRRRDNELSAREMLKQVVVAQEGGIEMERTIDAVASRVREYGARFENMVKEREANNAQYRFLLPSDSAEHQYYRCFIDARYVPVLPMLPFTEEGDASLYSSDTEEDSEWEKLRLHGRLHELGKASRLRLDAMLRGLTLRRERIARLMVFAIDHASAAEAVTDRLVGSALVATTPLPRKLARLYVISDILHNSTVSGAWRYRSLFETRLGAVFAHWGDVANSYAGRIKREACKDMARSVLAVWETWLVFETPRLAEWRASIDKGSGQYKATSPDMAAQSTEVGKHGPDSAQDDEAPAEPRTLDTADIDEDDIDGEALDGEALDGEALDGEALDGEALDGEALDGEALDGEALDGEALGENKMTDGEVVNRAAD